MDVRDAVERVARAGSMIPTPSGRGTFEVAEITASTITLLFGEKRTPTQIPWRLLNEAVAEIPRAGWMPIGAIHTSNSAEGTLEALLKPDLQRPPMTPCELAEQLRRAGAPRFAARLGHRLDCV